MSSYRSGLLTPPREEEERRIHRPVWRSLIIENAILLGVMLVTFVAQAFLGVQVPDRLQLVVNLLVATLPFALWLIFSVSNERLFPQPRPYLISVALLSALVARAIGAPLITEFLQIESWLPLAPALNRIIGYTFTVGIVECGLCYLTVRTLIWPAHIRDRYDLIAYMAAGAIGYSIVGSVEFALNGRPLVYVVALNTFANVTVLTITMVFVGYGMAGTLFDGAGVLLQPVTLATAALITGIALPLRSGFLNASFGVGGTSLPRYLFGIAFSAAIFVAGVFVLNFLFRFADRQAKERGRGEEEF